MCFLLLKNVNFSGKYFGNGDTLHMSGKAKSVLNDFMLMLFGVSRQYTCGLHLKTCNVFKMGTCLKRIGVQNYGLSEKGTKCVTIFLDNLVVYIIVCLFDMKCSNAYYSVKWEYRSCFCASFTHDCNSIGCKAKPTDLEFA